MGAKIQPPQGSGSVRKRSDGRWEARYRVDDPATGLPVRKSIYAESESEVRAKLVASLSGPDPDRMHLIADTYGQLNTEIEQHVVEMQKLELAIHKHRQEVKALLEKRAVVESVLGLDEVTPASSDSGAASNSNSSGSTAQYKRIREWAEAEGRDVPKRGRIPKKIYEAYKAAHAE